MKLGVEASLSLPRVSWTFSWLLLDRMGVKRNRRGLERVWEQEAWGCRLSCWDRAQCAIPDTVGPDLTLPFREGCFRPHHTPRCNWSAKWQKTKNAEEDETGGDLTELTGEPGNHGISGTHDLHPSQAVYTLWLTSMSIPAVNESIPTWQFDSLAPFPSCLHTTRPSYLGSRLASYWEWWPRAAGSSLKSQWATTTSVTH
jgi:hypothetical protein